MSVQNHAFSFEKNQVIWDTLDQKHYRVLYVSEDQSVCYWILIESTSNIPIPFSPEDVSLRIATGACEVVIDPSLLKTEKKISESGVRIRDSRYELIQQIVSREPDIYDCASRKDLLKEAEMNSGVSVTNLYRYMGLYWRNGMTKDALAPSYNNCGKSRDKGAPQSKRMGRPASPTDKYGNERKLFGKVLTKEDYENFRTAYSEYYLKKNGKASLNKAYERMKSILYSRVSPEDPDHHIVMDPHMIPSLSQFRYWCKKNRDVVEDTKKKEGENKYELKHRGITGNSDIGLFGPGAVAQIDATIADYYLVRKNDRAQVIGRPTLYFIIDVHTHMVMGMHITLENPSWESAMMALKNCAEDKTEYCKKFGIDITPEVWPVCGLPYSITADNGEMKGTGVENVIQSLGITIDNCPPFRGDLKAIIENSFHTLNIHLQDITPGYVDKDQGVRGGKDYRRDACLDLEQFTAMVIHCVLYHNNSHYMEKYVPTAQMRVLNVNSVPRDLWNYGMRYESGTIRHVPLDDVLRVLLPKTMATITEKGICHNGMYYTCEKAEKENWFSVARIEGRSKVSVAFDPTCVDHIYIFDEKDGTLSCDLVGKSTRYKNTTAEEADRWQIENKTRYENYQAEKGSQAKADLDWAVGGIIEQAKGSKAGTKEVQKVLNKHIIHQGREAEKEVLTGAKDAKKAQTEYYESQQQSNPIPRETQPDPILGYITDTLHDAGLY